MLAVASLPSESSALKTDPSSTTPDRPGDMPGQTLRVAFVAPRHPDGSAWPWLSRIGPMQRHRWQAAYIENTFTRWGRHGEKLSRFWIRWQYAKAMRLISRADLAYFFSTDINLGMTGRLSKLFQRPRRVYVGFTQDGIWPQQKIDALARAMQQLDGVTVFSEDERRLYISRYGLEPERTHVIPIHTDETGDYSGYPDALPADAPSSLRKGEFVLSLGSPNRRFAPIARACQHLKIPLVIITRPWHKNDSLDELAKMGATIITNADKMKSLTYLRCAKAAIMAFDTDQLPGAFTTLIHAMFMRTASVVTSCLGMSDYIADGENGLVTPHGNEDALQAAIDRMWNEPRLATRMGDAGFDRAQRLYSLEAAATMHAALAQRVMQSRQRA